MTHRRMMQTEKVAGGPLLAKRRSRHSAGMRLAGVRIGSNDLAAAVGAYELLLGVPGTPRAGGGVRFRLGRGSVDVVGDAPGLRAVWFVADGGEAALPAAHGIEVAVEPQDDAAAPPEPAPAIDHVVVHTPDPARAIALWRDRVGLRLALDRELPERHLRLLFFRSGGITLEYASPLPAPAGPPGDDRLHGVSYRVPDLAARRARRRAARGAGCERRRGMRPATPVAPVRSGTAGVPTLLLQADGPAG
jgi:catechol 2,3-dioxygenase-like lactoylglutathione lyase family enzyme